MLTPTITAHVLFVNVHGNHSNLCQWYSPSIYY